MRFNFPLPQLSRLRLAEIIIDLFAGGGGASEALKQAIGTDPALAYNHDVLAIGMHAANHPLTQHHREDIWHADPHDDGCKGAQAREPHPWITFVQLLAPLSQAVGK